jgi:hypothetical protein
VTSRPDRRRLLPVLAPVLAVVLAVAGCGQPPTSTGSPPAVATPPGRNLSDGAALAADPVTPPRAVPTVTPAGSGGQEARAAGPGDFTGFRPTGVVLPSGDAVGVVPSGVRDDGTLAVPDDPARAGWWTGGARPGERYGGVVIAAHVDSRVHGIGAFAQLLDVRPGASVRVGGGAGVSLRYRVSSVRQVDKARLAHGTDAFAQEVPNRLVLITCSGPFDPRRHRYRDNLVVIADPVG